MSSHLDLIVPCFNPPAGWERNLSRAVIAINSSLDSGAVASVILVNDGSQTGFGPDTERLLREAGVPVRIIGGLPNRGKGHAVRLGVQAATSPVQIFTDVDFPYRNMHVVDFYHRIVADEADVVIAGRGPSYYDALSPFRRVLSRSLQAFIRSAFRLKVSDTQGGLKAFNARGREVLLRTSVNRYLFDLEFIQRATKEGLRVLPLHVELREGVVLPSPRPGILLREVGNLIRLLARG